MNRLLPAAVLLLSATAAGPASGDWQVWTTAQTRRVLRDEPAGKGVEVRLAAARNEWRGFQILMRSDAPVAGIRVDSADLHGPEGAVLPAADARLYRQHQLEITTPTYRNDPFKPGWYPDPLIPFRQQGIQKGTVPFSPSENWDSPLKAVPFDLPADQTHGFWIDIFVPPAAKPGEYRGAYRVTAEGGKVVEVPIVLSVWDFDLPPVPTLRTALGSPADRMRGYYRQHARDGKEKEPADWRAVETQCAELLSQHRVNATPPAGSLVPVARPDGTFRVPAEQVENFRRFVDRYYVNAFQTAHPESVVKDPEAQRERLRAWLAAWDEAIAKIDRPHVVFYTYLKDEPNDEPAYRYVQKWGKAIKEAKTALRVLVVEQPQTQSPAWGDLYGAVDIWCPLFSLFDPRPAADRLALGETIWTYTALCQGEKTPWWHIDYPLLHYRVPAWISWRYRISGLLYWGGMAHWTEVDDPWTDANTYHPRGEKVIFHGEGTLVYPGRAVGYDGIAPSLRLKALRDSIEDYEYLAILDRLGRAAEAEKIVLPLAGSWFRWDPDPAAYEKARAQLAELIMSKK
jgi:hypothetical protein